MRTLIVFIFVLTLTVSCSEKHEDSEIESTLTVTNPVLKDTLIYQPFVCQIRSIQHIELRALEKGYLQDILVDEGQVVKKGQLLFQILPIIYQAELQKAKAELEYTEIEYQNTLALFNEKIVSKNELALVKAKRDKALAEISLAKAHLGFTEIRAPFNGIVGRFNDVRQGSLLDEGELLSTLSDNNKMWVYFNVTEGEYLDYALNKETDERKKVKLQLANNAMYPNIGTIETIEADFNNETGNIAFRATFDNADKILRNKETGNILMPVKLVNALLIPQEATFEVLDKKYVFVVKNNTVKSVEIKVGREMPHIYEVLSGLNSHDKILIEGLRMVKSGQHIKTKYKSMNQILKQLVALHAE